jgi:hypothetical protein
MSQRASLRRSLTALFKRGESALASETANPTELKAVLALLDQKGARLTQMDDSVMNNLHATLSGQELEVATDSEFNSCEEYQERYTLLRAQLVDALKSPGAEASSSPPRPASATESSSMSSSVSIGVKLPEFRIEPFDGSNPIMFPTFIDSFLTMIDANPNISDVQKFALFKDSLRGQPRMMIEGLLCTGSNYQLALKTIQEHYGDPNLLVGLYVHRLHQLAPVTSPASSEYANLIFSFEQSFSQLVNLIASIHEAERREVPTTSTASPWIGTADERVISFFLAPHLLSRLPSSTTLRWLDRNSSPMDRFNFRALIQFLKEDVRSRKSCQMLMGDGVSRPRAVRPAPPPHRSSPFRRPAKRGGPPPSSANMFAVAPTDAPALEQDTEVSPAGEALALVANLRSDHNSEKRVKLKLPFVCVAKCKQQKKEHLLVKCAEFLSASHQEKTLALSNMKRCLICFSQEHPTLKCVKPKCKRCGQSHNTVLCKLTKSAEPASPPQDDSLPRLRQALALSLGESHVAVEASAPKSLLQLISLRLSSTDGRRSKVINGLMDSGSSHSFVTTSVAKELKLKPEFYTTFRLSTFGGKLVDFESAQTPCVLSSLSGNEFKLTLKPFTSDALSNLQIPPKEIQPKQHLLNANVAIPEVYTETISPDIILGADVFFELVTGNVVRGSPLAVETRLGWTLYGHLDNTVSQPETKGHSLLTVAADDGSNLWRLESVGINGSPHERDEFPDPEFVNGKLQVRLPFLSDVRPASNFASAKKRADSLLKRLTAEQLHEYDSVFARDLERGTIEKLDECDVSEGFFLPHRAVFRPNKALRIVFNASCRSNESKRSLNDSLDQGAPMNNDLVNVLLRFRQGKYAQSCDVSKAFHCLLVHPDDRKWLRFVWKNEIWQHLKLAFGVTASPTLLAHSLRFVFAQLDDKKLAEALTNQLYVDDLLHSHDTMEELNEFREKVDKIFGVIDMQLIHNKDSRPLGIVWDRENDTLSIDVSKRELPSKLTRRNLLSYLSSFFDPLGWLQPAVLPLKLLFQKSWSLPQIGWDDTLPEEFSEQWKAWALSLPVESPSVPRWILLSKDATWELHCFSDASQSAAGVAIYSVVDGQARLLYSRSRLNPLKVSLTIPKGELVAFLLATRAALLICSQLKKPLSCTFWTDATTVIHWLGRKGSSLRSEVFVKNRIQQIHDIFRQLPNISVRYIDTSLNPADRASRGVSFEELSASDWFTGPSFLSLPQEQWPIAPPDVSTLTPEKMGISEAQVCFVADPPAPPHPACYSSLRKLVSVTAMCLGFIARLRQKVARRNGNVDNTALPLLADVGAYGSPEAKRRALFVWIRKAQEEAFSEDFDSLQQGLPLSRQSPLWSLNPTWDLQLKCIVVNPRYGGQLVLLPRRAAVTRLIVLQIHECLCHANVTATLAEARVSYWIPQGNAAVKSILHFCLPCRQKKQLPFSPPEGALASFRITPAPAFQTFGLDHVGAFQSPSAP